MFTKEARAELIEIIAQGVTEAMAIGAIDEPSVADVGKGRKATAPVDDDDIFDDDDEDDVNEAPTKAELVAKKKAATSAKRKATIAKKKAAAVKTKADDDDDEFEDDDDDFDEDDDGSDAEVMEIKISHDEMMALLKPLTEKHPSGKMEGRKAAAALMQSSLGVKSFKDIKELDREPFANAFKDVIKAL